MHVVEPAFASGVNVCQLHLCRKKHIEHMLYNEEDVM